ncbi:hypothetical protein SeMB42_g03214 [Synchytrium endobioticum]|uniref:CMP/dCMP-type deaminase domain-containing protein n=1 Tax=Synchytrium endobioticum TaxID=286115 RepID=A0A507D8I8_9FUNG|nr:hypothetical protein SeMB42_g03214 [Synchytrium endobioticum]
MQQQSQSSEWKNYMEAVLPAVLSRALETMDVWVANVPLVKVSRFLDLVNRRYPQPEFNITHLKRVKRALGDATAPASVLIAPVQDLMKPEVPRHAAITRKELEQAARLWPVSFKEFPTPVIQDQEFAVIKARMAMAIREAEMGRSCGQLGIGAVVVHPETDTVLAACHDKRRSHPLHHATMVAIAQVAEREREKRGLAKNSSRFMIHGTPHLMNASSQISTSNGDSEHHVNGSMNTNMDGHSKHSHRHKPHSIDDNKCIVDPISGDERSRLGYYCTGYELYITREPCIMCAMALVHSRIARVFYGFATPGGGLGSELQVHTHPFLNHKFGVFKNLEEQACLDIFGGGRNAHGNGRAVLQEADVVVGNTMIVDAGTTGLAT